MINTHFADRIEEISELEKQNDATVRKIVGEAAVLLENKDILPLSNLEKLYFLEMHFQIGGTGSGCVNSWYIEKGLENDYYLMEDEIKNNNHFDCFIKY